MNVRPASNRRLRVPQPDFVAGPPRPPAVAWLLLACGALAVAVASIDFAAARERLAAQEERAARWESALRRSAPAPAPAAPADAAEARRGRDAAVRIVAGLGHPWQDLLVAIETATPPGIRWNRLEHDAARPELRLEGMAPDHGAALALVDALAVQPLFTAAMMNRLDDDRGRDEAGVRFEVGLRLQRADPP